MASMQRVREERVNPDQQRQANAPGGDRRVEIVLDADLYERVRIKAMKQRRSLRAVGAELFDRWADDDSTA